MRLLALIAALVNLLAALFVLGGLVSYGWFHVSYSLLYTATTPIISNQTIDITSTFTIFGIVEYTVNIGTNSTSVFLDHWHNKTTCTGSDCGGLSYDANRDCSQLAMIEGDQQELQDVQNFRAWYAGAACNFPKATIAMMTLALICLAPAVPFTGLVGFDLAPPLIPMIINAVAWLWLFLAMCIYGGGVSAKAQASDWNDNNSMVLVQGLAIFADPNTASYGLGAAYGLPCTSIFLLIIVIGLLFVEWRKAPESGTSKAKEMTRV